MTRPQPSPGDRSKGLKGQTKKHGAGGKFVWGKAGDENGPPSPTDKKDPNYDSDID